MSDVPRLTKEQAAIVGAYTGILAGPFDEMHEYIEQIMGRPVFTHEMGGGINDEIKKRSKDDFLGIARR